MAVGSAQHNVEDPAGLEFSEAPKTEEQIAEEARMDRLNAFGVSMAKSRSEAISARMSSGIEEVWREDQEFYEGIDDLNRGEERFVRTEKPVQGAGDLSTKRSKTQSTVFPNITGPFVDAAAAHISDILLPTEEPPWSLEPTPIPEIDEKAEAYAAKNPGGAEAIEEEGGLGNAQDPMAAPQRAAVEQKSAQDMAGVADGVSEEQAFEQKKIAKAVAEATAEQIWDWHVECQFNSEVRKVIEDCARLGVGILKGPVPTEERIVGWQPETKVRDENLGGEKTVPARIKVETVIRPESYRVNPWNFFPASGCGTNPQNGDDVWERDYLTKRQLMALRHNESYIASQIEACLNEGPSRAEALPPESVSVEGDSQSMNKYEIWYCYGMADREDLEAAGCDCEDLDVAQTTVEAHIVMVNNRVIKATMPATEFAGFPYDVVCWRERENYWAGIGVSRMVRTSQKMVVGATRSMMNNAGLAGGPMIVFKQGVVRPADGVAGIAPRKVFYIAKDDQTIADATKAIGVIKVDPMVDHMLKIVQFGLQMAENNSGFPLLAQGQMGRAPDRVGVVNVLDKNTNAIKRRFARQISDRMMAPHIRRYYIYHLLHGNSDQKGDLQVNVKGYQSQVERDIQNQELGQMAGIVTDIRFGLDPKKWVKEYLKSRNLSASAMEFDDENWEQILANYQQILESSGGEDPRVTVAKINGQSRLATEQLRGEYAGSMFLNKAAAEAQQQELDRKLEIFKTMMIERIKEMDMAGMDKREADKIRASLTEEWMKISSVHELAQMKASADMLPKPPFEPPGRAPVGESYQR